ncbi:FtsX-like permease family protein [Actinoplanes sp. NPDC049668]|uniref:ABC transporter permease n=1 Tax=unclassified Actinoplanes TaxID=2626549 RepID=UPI0033B7D79F
MSALGRVVRSGVGRRRVQTVVIGLVVMIAVASAVLGGSLLVASNAPFDRAFAQQRGAHLTAQFDAGAATAAQLAASAHVAGVAAAAGPFPTAVVNPVDNHDRPFPPATLVGRAEPGGAVDAVTLLEGRWATAPGELVLAGGDRPVGGMRLLGRQWRMPDLPGTPALTIVGIARSVSVTADGWVVPAQIAALTGSGAPGGNQMLYRLDSADSAARVEAGRAAVQAALPAGALTAARSWLTTRAESANNTALLVPFLVAFGVLGVVMAVLIVGNVIAGAVGTGTRRIGILKALGFTPNQVVRAYLAQALVPAAVGAALGVVAGNALTVPLLAETNRIYGTSDSGVAPWVDLAVLAGALALVCATAWAAASRAGRLRTVDALAVGRTPTPGRGQAAARLSARIPLPRPMTLGLAHPFARPVRSATIVAAIAFGAAAVTFSVGLGASLNRVQATENHGDVVIHPSHHISAPPPGAGPGTEPGPVTEPGPPPEIDPAQVLAAITAQDGTAGYSGFAQTEVTAAGLTGSVEALAFTGDKSSYGYQMVDGTWFGGPGEVVVATPFLTATGTEIGDTVVLTDHGEQLTVRIVGEVFNTENDGLQLLTAAETLAAAEPELRAQEYNVVLRPGTDPVAYAEALSAALQPLGAQATVVENDADELLIIINSLTTLLTLLLVTVAALGVLNMVVLETRERVHDLGVHKALGMSPRQTVAMVIASVVVTGLAGGAVGMPIGVLLQRVVLGDMGRIAGFNLPAAVIDVYRPAELVLFALGGLVIAVLGALLPAGWAARTSTAAALRTE